VKEIVKAAETQPTKEEIIVKESKEGPSMMRRSYLVNNEKKSNKHRKEK
jgi:hypothetical protein